MNLSKDAESIMSASMTLAQELENEYVTPEHVLYCILDENENIFDDIDEDYMKEVIDRFLRTNLTPLPKGTRPNESMAFNLMIKTAIQIVEGSQRSVIEVGDILVAIYNTHCQGQYILKQLKVDPQMLTEAASELGSDDNSEAETDENGQPIPNAQRNNKRKKYLAKYSVEMVQRAKDGKYDPIIGREKEVERTIQILCRKKKNNPVHVGDAGVGKSSIMESIAQRIAAGTVPDILKDYKIYSVDLGAMLAGSKYRGEFEQKLDGVIKETIAEEKSIMYIDEIHNLCGAGAGSSGTMDASNILRPYLSTGDLKVVGATTYEDFRKTIEKDSALARRFQKIDILEPSEEDALLILKGLKKSYEDYHNVEYSDDILLESVKLAKQYLHDRKLPDSAIDVIDEAGSLLRMRNFTAGNTDQMKVIITSEDIENVVSKMANIPPKTISTTDTDKLKTLEDDLKAKVYGQNEAIEAIVRSIKRSKAGFRKTSKTIANFMFAGRTGTGKSYLAQTLADLMGVKLIKWDMSELQEKNSISKWIGAPAGYIGHDEGGQLVEQIRQNPNAVLLLDEIEKAASDVYNVLLQIMDSATLTDSHGKKADFSNVILIATSNVGAQKIGAKEIGFGAVGTGQIAKDAITKAYEKQFSPEFRNRVDQLIMFNDLGDCELKRIVYAEIDEFQKILDEKKVRLTVEEPVILWLLKNGYDEKMGARPLARLFEKNVKDKLLDAILFGELKDGGQAIATLDGDEVKMMTLENIVDNAIVATV